MVREGGHEGRIFPADSALVPPEAALPVPPFQAQPLNGGPSVDVPSAVLVGRVTLLAVCFKQHGYSMLPAWRQPWQGRF
ncbi:unnamed protein product, partial [Phaeothamnion confervicola]